MSVLESCTEEDLVRSSGFSAGLRRRLGFLTPADRELIEFISLHQHTYGRLGRLMGVTSGTILRRFRRLAQRLADPVVTALIDLPAPIPTDLRQLGLAHFLHRRTIRQLAGDFAITPGEVRQRLAYIRGWVRGVTRSR